MVPLAILESILAVPQIIKHMSYNMVQQWLSGITERNENMSTKTVPKVYTEVLVIVAKSPKQPKFPSAVVVLDTQ